MLSNILAPIVALSLALQGPASPTPCPPKTTACANDTCTPIGVPCPSASEISVAAGQPIRAPVVIPAPNQPIEADWDEAPKRGEAASDSCGESEAEFTARKGQRLLAFSLGSIAASGVGLGLLLGLREPIPESQRPVLPNCVNSKPCGRSCISYDDVCRVGQEPTMRATVGGIVGGLVFAAIALGLIIGGKRNVDQMQRAGGACSAKGCTLTLRF